jgi:hypothetical protein
VPIARTEPGRREHRHERGVKRDIESAGNMPCGTNIPLGFERPKCGARHVAAKLRAAALTFS